MAIENVQQLLSEQLGEKGNTEKLRTAAQSGKNFYCVHFPVESVVASITVADATGESALQTTLPAGTTLFMNITAITLTSGVGIGYRDDIP